MEKKEFAKINYVKELPDLSKIRNSATIELEESTALLLMDLGWNFFTTDSIYLNNIIEEEKSKLIERLGETKAFSLYNRIKDEAYNQTESNSLYILSKLRDLNYMF